MKQILIWSLGILYALGLNAQDYQWAGSVAGPSLQYGEKVAVDGQGNVITMGYLRDSADFDPSSNVLELVAQGAYDMFVQKLDPNGNLLWAERFGGSSSDRGYDMTLDHQDNIWVTGDFRGTVDFDPSPAVSNLTAVGNSDVFILKLAPNGSFLWAGQIGGTGYEKAEGIAADSSGNIYLTGGYYNAVDFDPSGGVLSLNSPNRYSAYVMKITPIGNLAWVKSMDSQNTSNVRNRGYDLVIDENQDVVITGNFVGTVDFDPGPGSLLFTSGSTIYGDLFVQKLDSNGNLIWVHKITGGSFKEVSEIAVDANNRIALLGAYSGMVDFDPGTGIQNQSTSMTAIYVLQLDGNGNFNWVNSYEGIEDLRGLGLAVDRFGFIYHTGHFIGTVDFDPSNVQFNLTTNGAYDAYIQKLTPGGAMVWAHNFGDSINDCGYDVSLDPFTNVYATGYFGTTVDFDPGTGMAPLSSAGDRDAYTFKWSQCSATLESISVTACGSYTVPSGGETYSTSGTYFDTLQNILGCDSFLTIQLSINNATTSSESATACESYTWNGATFTTSGTYLDTTQNAMGCDSFMTLNLTVNNATTSSESATACESYTWNGATFTTSGTYLDTTQNAMGCDSFMTLNLIVNNATTSSESATACESYTWNGATFTTSGTYFDTTQNAMGCDSFMTLNLTVNNSTTSSESATACGSYNWNGASFTSSGTYLDTIQNAVGCDSIMTLNLTINNVTSSFETEIACGTYTWNGTPLTASGIYTDTIQNAMGCDSFMTLNLTINNSTTATIQPETCDSYTSPSGNYTWDSTGFYMDTIPNQSGCDSIISIQLLVLAVDTSVSTVQGTLSADMTGAAYQWIDCSTGMTIPGETGQSFTPITSGSYAVVVLFSGCQDTSGCRQVTVVGTDPGEPMPSWKAYPNPNQGQFKIDWYGETAVKKMMVYNAQGQLIHVQSLEKGSNLVQLPQAAVGIYFIRIAGDGFHHQKRIWIQ